MATTRAVIAVQGRRRKHQAREDPPRKIRWHRGPSRYRVPVSGRVNAMRNADGRRYPGCPTESVSGFKYILCTLLVVSVTDRIPPEVAFIVRMRGRRSSPPAKTQVDSGDPAYRMRMNSFSRIHTMGAMLVRDGACAKGVRDVREQKIPRTMWRTRL